ncbi:MAG: twin-arginine translocation signal domain-containing protein, partial [Candidatus Omnitrophica bacterium]|nr:twin-arginine translocation signal domain-containing protein [Candidatus Omnitrophota bacterium]
MDIFSPKGRFSRRSFIKTTAQVGAVLSFPTIIPSSALARQGRIGPNDKIRIANI